jgi:hypothetical protein
MLISKTSNNPCTMREALPVNQMMFLLFLVTIIEQ